MYTWQAPTIVWHIVLYGTLYTTYTLYTWQAPTIVWHIVLYGTLYTFYTWQALTLCTWQAPTIVWHVVLYGTLYTLYTLYTWQALTLCTHGRHLQLYGTLYYMAHCTHCTRGRHPHCVHIHCVGAHTLCTCTYTRIHTHVHCVHMAGNRILGTAEADTKRKVQHRAHVSWAAVPRRCPGEGLIIGNLEEQRGISINSLKLDIEERASIRLQRQFAWLKTGKHKRFVLPTQIDTLIHTHTHTLTQTHFL